MNSMGAPYSMTGPAISIESLRKSYGDTLAVDGLDLTVHAGQIVGLIGPDGAGKTTTMRILCGLLHPDSGRAQVLGFGSATEAKRLKPHLGYMPQRFSLYPDLTVAENLRFFADLFGVTGTDRRRREDELLEFSRLAEFRARRAGQLSGGMKQKLALSCTLIHTPQVLILDEPTTGVDPVSRREFWRILGDLAREGLALLVSTPYMDEAELCARVVLMHEGRALVEGTVDELPGHFPADLYAVEGTHLKEARQRLLGLEGVAVHRFGDRLHVSVEHGARIEQVRQRLEGLSTQLSQIEPTTEDLFVELTRSKRRVEVES
ncbi:MAG: ABC transporter ATP-binding protein [Candidatus Eisenbacteria bacterium]